MHQAQMTFCATSTFVKQLEHWQAHAFEQAAKHREHAGLSQGAAVLSPARLTGGDETQEAVVCVHHPPPGDGLWVNVQAHEPACDRRTEFDSDLCLAERLPVWRLKHTCTVAQAHSKGVATIVHVRDSGAASRAQHKYMVI